MERVKLIQPDISPKKWGFMTKKFKGVPQRGGFPGGMGGLGGMGNMGSMLKQMEKMQADLQRSQSEIQSLVFEEQAGGGAVKIAMDGTYSARSITVSPEVLQAGDVEMLQDLLLTAINGVTTQISNRIRDTMKQATGGIDIPGLSF
jgi:DNA-binding YbaB/EbfC family protein